MLRVVGLTRDELETRERVFDGLVTKSVRRTLRKLTASVDLLTAAAAPELSSTPSEPGTTIPAGALGVVATAWTQEVDAELFPYLVQTFVDAAADVYAAMPETSGVAPKITYDLAATYLQSAANRLKGIGDVVWNDMRTQLALGYEAGESVNQLAARLRTVAKISEPRALTIARTEVVPAANFGSLQQLKAVGFTDDECRKEWLATEDARTRLAHVEADGQLVGLNQPFVVGGDFLQVPGDPAGRAENVINCRCSVAYVFDEDDDEDDNVEPLAASGGWGSYSFAILTAADKWTAADEAKVKRDSHGKFAKKAGGPVTSGSLVLHALAAKSGEIVAVGTGANAVRRIRKSGSGYYIEKKSDVTGEWNVVSKKFTPAALKSYIKVGEWGLPESEEPGVSLAKVAPAPATKPVSTPTATITAHVPLHINTAVIYKKGGHQDQEVIAQKPGNAETGSVAQRLIWDAGSKKFMLQTETKSAGWIGVELYTKGKAYEKFSKETGWMKPAKAESVTAITPPKLTPAQQQALDDALGKTATPSAPIVVKTMTEVAPAQPPGKPVKLNTVAIYKTKYADGTVVAEKTDASGEHRLVWNAGKKKFLLQKIDGAMWVPQGEFNKGEAYQKFSKEIGWTQPTGVMPSAKPDADKILKSVADMDEAELSAWIDENADLIKSQKKWPEMTTPLAKQLANYPDIHNKYWDTFFGQPPGSAAKLTAQIQEGGEVDDGDSTAESGVSAEQIIKALSVDEFKNWISTISNDELAEFDANDLSKLDANVLNLLNVGLMLYDDAVAASNKIQAAAAGSSSAVTIPDFSADPPHVAVDFYSKLTQDDFDGLSASDQAIIVNEVGFYDVNTPVGQKPFSEKIADFVAGKGDDSNVIATDPAALELQILMMTQTDYDALSEIEQETLNAQADKLPDPTGVIDAKLSELATNYALSHGGSPPTAVVGPKVTFDWDDNSGPHGMTPIYYEGQLVGHAESLANGAGAQIYDLNPVSPLSSYGQPVATVDFDEGETISNAVIDLIDIGQLSSNPAAKLMPTTHPSAVVPAFDVGEFLDKDDLAKSGIINFMSSKDVDSLSAEEYADVAAEAAALYSKGFLSKKDFDEFNAKGTKTVVPNVTSVAPPAVPSVLPTGSTYFVQVHGKIKKIDTISTPASPAPPPNMYKLKTPAQAATMQQTMLSAAGKTWTGPQTAAIKKYGTSVGYRSINAILRDDEKQLKLFNDAQLKAAVNSAVNLQNAMTPLTDDVKLFRGTGAHAFGQNSIAPNFDELKKLQGTVVTDKGFMSTTVDEKKTVSYDYAKKPIQVVVNAPAGTPALHVDSAIPGHNEHEILLAAGTSYRMDEVRKATAEDRAKYGNHVEYVVETTIVPSSAKIDQSTPLGAPPAKPAPAVAPNPLAPAAPSASAVSSPTTVGELKKPIKITTTVIYKTKWQHGAVVGYHKNADNSLSRLVWSETNKKFISQNYDPFTGEWVNFAGYGKGEAYEMFGKKLKTDWYAAAPGDSAIGSGGLFGTTSVAPKVSTTGPAPATIAPAKPAAPAAPPPKFDAAELQKLHGQIPTFGPTYRRELFDSFKKKSTQGFVTLSTPEAGIFTALKETLDKHNQDPSAIPLNMLQLLKLVDEESTNKVNFLAKQKGESGNKANEQLYEKKLVAWLQTPAGATYATELLHPTPVTFSTSGAVNANKTYKSKNFTPQIIDTLHKIKDPAQIGTPDPNATVFTAITHSKALALQKQQLDAEPWTTTQRNALRKYTGPYYTEMNPVVRDVVKDTQYKSESALLTAARTAVNVQAGMRPLPENVKVFRKTTPSQFSAFGLTNSASFEQMKKLEGHLFIDQAPMSTSIDPNKWSGTVHFEIDLPKGTPAIYVQNISQNSSEMEMLLGLGLKYRILSVKAQGGITKVHMRVEA